MENNPNVERYNATYGLYAATVLGLPELEPNLALKAVETLFQLPPVEDHHGDIPTPKSVVIPVARLGLALVRTIKKRDETWEAMHLSHQKAEAAGFKGCYLPAIGTNLRKRGGVRIQVKKNDIRRWNVKEGYKLKVDREDLEKYPDTTYDPTVAETLTVRQDPKDRLAAIGVSKVWYMLCNLLYKRGYRSGFTPDTKFNKGLIEALVEVSNDPAINLAITEANAQSGIPTVRIPSIFPLTSTGPQRVKRALTAEEEMAAEIADSADSVS